MTSLEAVEIFISQIKWTHEVDYGDFKRKLGLYITRLSEELGPIPKEVQSKIERLKQDAVFEPDGDIENTKLKSISMAEDIREHFSRQKLD